MADGDPRPGLHALVAEGRGGILLFGITPPKSSTAPADRARIAERTLARLGPLDLDGLILYDIDDESDRIAEDRPFPYLPTSDPATFYTEHLGAWTRPVVVYRSIGKYAPDELGGWLGGLDPSRQLGVFVGATVQQEGRADESHRGSSAATHPATGDGRGRGDDHRAAHRTRRRAPADAGQAGGRVRVLRQPGDLRRGRHPERAVGLLLRLRRPRHRAAAGDLHPRRVRIGQDPGLPAVARGPGAALAAERAHVRRRSAPGELRAVPGRRRDPRRLLSTARPAVRLQRGERLDPAGRDRGGRRPGRPAAAPALERT